MHDIQQSCSTENSLIFGRYRVIKLLGEGAMGKVYLADDPLLDRKIALKVVTLHSSLSKETRQEYCAQFSKEAKTCAKLNHQSIVMVYDMGEEFRIPWIAFQYIQGESLQNLLERRGKISTKLAISIALDIASALEHAHGWSLVHRDIKPSNILIENYTGIAKLTDFGIVKSINDKSVQTEISQGSIGYMAPEQIEDGSIDGRADLFSLGVVLYYMLTGKHPFIKSTIEATVTASCTGDYVPLREVIDQVHPSLDWAIHRTLAPKREDRFANAAEMVSQLRRALSAYIEMSTPNVQVIEKTLEKETQDTEIKIKIPLSKLLNSANNLKQNLPVKIRKWAREKYTNLSHQIGL